MLPKKTQQVFNQAWPIILSNASIPLLGLVDTAILGHLPSGVYLAAVTLGAVIFSFLYWSFGFLRMGTTGLIAQAYGAQEKQQLATYLSQALIFAVLLGFALQALRPWLEQLIALLNASEEAKQLALEYVQIRLYSAPAVLVQYVILGAAIGMGRSKIVLLLLLITNLTNLVLDVYFVLGLGMLSEGVAWASLIAEVLAAVLGLAWLMKTYNKMQVRLYLPSISWEANKKLIQVNANLFVRTLALLFALAFFTRQGATQGDAFLAANAVLMQLIMLASYLLDGFAQAVEGQFGAAYARDKRNQSKNKNTKKEAQEIFAAGLFLSVVTGFLLVLVFALTGKQLIYLLTDLPEIAAIAQQYLPWLVLVVAISVPAYLFDGVFIGATLTAPMRNSLLLALVVYLVSWWLFTGWLEDANFALWLAFLIFNSLRGVYLGWVYQAKLR